MPAHANQSDDAIRRGPFALHDAQSAIAREYGFRSWAALRAHVSAVLEAQKSPEEEMGGGSVSDAPSAAESGSTSGVQAAAAGESPSAAQPPAASASAGGGATPAVVDEYVLIRMASGKPLPAELESDVRAALKRRGMAAAQPTPRAVPVLPLRNAIAFPGAVFPVDVARPSTLRAIDAALARDPEFLAVFAQRASDTERPALDDLHSAGCLCRVLYAHRPAQGAWIERVIGLLEAALARAESPA